MLFLSECGNEGEILKLTMLGTGSAAVTRCYNTCFLLKEKKDCFLVDGGGGNGILTQLEKAGEDWKNIHDIFVTHKHIDHILGIIWIVRVICQGMNQGKYEGELRVYAHKELIEILENMLYTLIREKETKLIGKRVHLICVEDGEEKTILQRKTVFFDIHSTKAKQFGFTICLENGGRMTCCGDEPYKEAAKPYAAGSKWLLHEAFCLYSQADIFKPYEKHHSTVLEACRTAEKLEIENLLLYHTEDKNIVNRKELYTEEGKKVFSGKIYVPEDLETIEIS